MAVPVPFEVSPAGTFDGDDGLWSTFVLSAGTPRLNFKTLPSTQIGYSLVIDLKGCTVSDDPNCLTERGYLFDTGTSKSWRPIKDGTYKLAIDEILGYGDAQGSFAQDVVGLVGSNGGTIVLDDQVLASEIRKDFYLGFLPIGVKSPDFGNGTVFDSFLTSAFKKNKIPSLSIGYTAGAQYRNQTGSLVFGGFDASRFTPNNIEFIFSPTEGSELSLGLQNIQTINGDNTTSVLKPIGGVTGIPILIDSSISELWLPEDTCEAIASALGLSYSANTLLYTISDENRDNNKKKNVSLSFQIGNSPTTGPSTTINIPYPAFDMIYTSPLVPRNLSVFPMRRATNLQQYRLGRAFLQEAYLSIDYTNKVFNVSQVVTEPSDKDIRPIGVAAGSPTDSSSSPSSTATPGSTGTPVAVSSSSSGGIGAGAIAGIVVGVVVVAILALIGFCLYRRKNKTRRPRNSRGEIPELDAQNGNMSQHHGLAGFFHKLSRGNSVKRTNYHSHSPSIVKSGTIVHETEGRALSQSPPANAPIGSGYFTPMAEPVELHGNGPTISELHSQPGSPGSRVLSPDSNESQSLAGGAWGTGGTNYESHSPHASVSSAVQPDLNHRVSDRSVPTITAFGTTADYSHPTEMSAFTSPVVGWTRYRDNPPSPRQLDQPSTGAPSPEIERDAFMDVPSLDEREEDLARSHR